MTLRYERVLYTGQLDDFCPVIAHKQFKVNNYDKNNINPNYDFSFLFRLIGKNLSFRIQTLHLK